MHKIPSASRGVVRASQCRWHMKLRMEVGASIGMCHFLPDAQVQGRTSERPSAPDLRPLLCDRCQDSLRHGYSFRRPLEHC